MNRFIIGLNIQVMHIGDPLLGSVYKLGDASLGMHIADPLLGSACSWFSVGGILTEVIRWGRITLIFPSKFTVPITHLLEWVTWPELDQSDNAAGPCKEERYILYIVINLGKMGRFIHLAGTITHSRESASIRQPSAATCYFQLILHLRCVYHFTKCSVFCGEFDWVNRTGSSSPYRLIYHS